MVPNIRRIKACKSEDPEVTIGRARKILASLGIEASESVRHNKTSNTYSAVLRISNRELAGLALGTNGKGFTESYALASAYGEFFERLQNNRLIPVSQLKFATARQLSSSPDPGMLKSRLESEGLILDYQYAPDELHLSNDELAISCDDIIRKMFNPGKEIDLHAFLDTVSDNKENPCLPFYSVFDDDIRNLPIRIVLKMCATNGMCAGNTPSEALIQGISEIFERFALRTIYTENITPPTIPESCFDNTDVLNRLRSMTRNSGIHVTVKDCSLGIGLPVIGLLLTNITTGRYAFHLGADPSPVTALERCLSELFQGSDLNVQRRFHPIPKENGTIRKQSALQKAYYATLVMGDGIWPSSILSSTDSYRFNGFTHPESLSDESDLRFMLDTIDKQGWRLYVRDSTFLGFPSYHVLIPGISEVRIHTGQLFDTAALEKRQHTLQNPGRADVAQLEDLATTLAALSQRQNPADFVFSDYFPSNTDKALDAITIDLLLTYLHTRLQSYETALECFRRYQRTCLSTGKSAEYLAAVDDFLRYRTMGHSSEQIKKKLSADYVPRLAYRVLDLFGDPSRIFAKAGMPTCFDCPSCGLVETCRYFDLLKMVKRIHLEQSRNIRSQKTMHAVFHESVS